MPTNKRPESTDFGKLDHILQNLTVTNAGTKGSPPEMALMQAYLDISYPKCLRSTKLKEAKLPSPSIQTQD